MGKYNVSPRTINRNARIQGRYEMYMKEFDNLMVRYPALLGCNGDIMDAL